MKLNFYVALAMLGFSGGAQAAPVLALDETKLTADDAAEFDQFGLSVAISGDIAIVGSYADDDGGSSRGSAYLFDATTGDQIAKLTARGEGFGLSVAISGNTAIVGNPSGVYAGSVIGLAYLFDTTTGAETEILMADDWAQGDRFGSSVAISGNTAIVGSYGDDHAGRNSGSAYLFDVFCCTLTFGDQIAKLTASDAAARDEFGWSVAISGNTAIVGSPLDEYAGSSSGSAYLFDATTGDQTHKLTADDAAGGDLFGFSVAISGDTAIVGSYLNDEGGSGSGSAYLFDATTGDQIAKLTASDAAAGERFGESVAISGDIAIVGSRFDGDAGSASGSAYLFDISDLTDIKEIAKLTASDAAFGDQFGFSVAISGETALVGSVLDDDAGSGSGSAYLYTLSAPPVAPVPLPAGLWLLGPAFGGLLVLRRRRQSAA